MPHDAPAQFIRDRVAAQFADLASAIQERRSDAILAQCLTKTQAFCEQAARAERSKELKHLLTHLRTALETWQRIWPRLGQEEEFRLAIAREARLWSRRLGSTNKA